ncbi:hypothetical protein Tco_0232158 [Tanacetum coccineum]
MLAPIGGGLILYQAYGNLYAMTGRKAHLLEDKQIPSVRIFDEVFSSWMAFGGNTRDLERGDGIASIKRRRRALFSDGVWNLETASGPSSLTKSSSSNGDVLGGGGVSSNVTFKDSLIFIVFSTWMAFGGNIRKLGSFGEEKDEITDLHQILKEILLTERGDGVAGIKRCRRDPSSNGVRDLAMASGRDRLNEDLESST